MMNLASRTSAPIDAIDLHTDLADSVTRGTVAALRRWFARVSLDERTRYLTEATSHEDLERRLEIWDEAEHRGSPFPYLG